jgi:lysophospholipase L1-like esterase
MQSPQHKTSRRSLPTRLLWGTGAALVLAALLLALLEGALWVADYRCPPLATNLFEMDLYAPHHRQAEDLFWALKPNSPRWQVNRVGFRDPGPGPVPQNKPPGEFRLAFLGDSSVFGWAADVDQKMLDARSTFVHQVQLRLNALPGRRVTYRCLNFGVPGYSSYQGAILLRKTVLRYQPDLVLTYFGTNDMSHSDLSDSARARIRPVRGALHRLRVAQLVGCLLRREPDADQIQQQLIRTGPPRVSTEEYAAKHLQMARQVRARGGRLVGLSHVWHQTTEHDPARPETALSSLPGVQIRPDGLMFDLLTPLRRVAARGGPPLFFDSRHPTERGHAVIADAIVRELRRQKPIPDS